MHMVNNIDNDTNLLCLAPPTASERLLKPVGVYHGEGDPVPLTRTQVEPVVEQGSLPSHCPSHCRWPLGGLRRWASAGAGGGEGGRRRLQWDAEGRGLRLSLLQGWHLYMYM